MTHTQNLIDLCVYDYMIAFISTSTKVLKMNHKIDANIPIPPAKAGRPPVWPMANMQPGESAFIAGKTITRAANIARLHRIRKGWQFTCRTVTENGVKGVRVWRTA